MKYSVELNSDKIKDIYNAIYCIDFSYGNGMDSDTEYGWRIIRPILVKLLSSK